MPCQSTADAWEEAVKTNPDVRKAIEILIDAVIANHRAKCRREEAAALGEGVEEAGR